MEIGDDFLPELDFDFIEQEEEDEVVDDKVVNDEIPEEEDDNLSVNIQNLQFEIKRKQNDSN